MVDEAIDLEERERIAKEKMRELQIKLADPSYYADPSEVYEKTGSSLACPREWGEGISF